MHAGTLSAGFADYHIGVLLLGCITIIQLNVAGTNKWPSFFFLFFYSILRWSVAVSTMRRQSSRIAGFPYYQLMSILFVGELTSEKIIISYKVM